MIDFLREEVVDIGGALALGTALLRRPAEDQTPVAVPSVSPAPPAGSYVSESELTQ
jgi:hypothetical protein